MRVFHGEIKRLIINIAPRYSKTEIAVINFIAWTLGHFPDAEFIHTSYSGRLASNNSWQARDMVAHPAYQEIFPDVKLRTDSQARDEWRTTKDGICYAVGAGGTITGYGAGKLREGFGGAIIIDDPHKADEARSDVMRQNVIDWFLNTLESRKNSPHTPIILIMQRLHEKDLSGFLLNGGNGEKWTHVCLETLLPDGSALWPEKHTAETLISMQQASPYTFHGQYQQRPSPPEGNIFRPDKIDTLPAIPAGTKFVRAWDFGATKGGGDYTVGAKIGKMPDGRYLIADIERFQGAPHEVEAALKNAAGRDGTACKIRIPQDPGQAGKAQVANLTKMLYGYTVHALPISGDKVTRAEPFAAQVNVGNVSMIKNDSWNDALISEMRLFPNGAHDDQIDALSDAFSEFNTSTTTGLLEYYERQWKAMMARRQEGRGLK
jgi:predicted phage terminase large subunit-like protein